MHTDRITMSSKCSFKKSYLANRVTAPATTGEATLVPERVRQLPLMLDPLTAEPYVTMSGFTRPYLKSENM